ncbi:MAG: hypothetical protein NW226_02650 [Microscillaceae bacterium]|nr:hypothetical protein [Microscillaceae bacterium]
MDNTSKREEFEIPSLGIRYVLEQTETGNLVFLKEDDFERLFEKLRELQDQVTELQNQVIEDLKKQALIKNILNS